MDRDRAQIAPRSASIGAAASAVGLVVVAATSGIFYAYPLATVLGRGIRLAALREVLGDGGTWRIVWFTTWQAAASTLATVMVGLPIAHLLARRRFPGLALVRVLVAVPFVLPTLVVASAILAVSDALGLDDGPVRLPGTAWGIIVAHLFLNTAVVARAVAGVWSQLDDRPLEAARALGASPLRAFTEVTLPRLAPAVWSSAAIVFLFCFTSFGVVVVIGGLRRPTLETEIWRHATQRGDVSTAAVLGLVQLVVVVAALAINARLRRRIVTEAPASAVDLARRPRGRREWAMTAGVLALIGLVLVAPIAVLVERSLAVGSGHGLDHYRSLGDQSARIPILPVSGWTAVGNSLAWGCLAMVAATVVGTIAGTIRSTASPSGRLVDLLAAAPLGTSAVLVGFGILIALDEPPLDWRSRWWIVPAAQAVIGIPFVARAVGTARASIDPRLRDAAATLGASPWRTWREIDLPIVARGVAVGAAFAFAIAVGEFGATTFLARPQRPTATTAIARLLGRPGESAFGQAMALSVILMIVTASAVALIDRLRSTVAGEL